MEIVVDEQKKPKEKKADAKKRKQTEVIENLDAVKELIFSRIRFTKAGSGRSSLLYFLALRMRDFGIEEGDAILWNMEANSKFCEPPEDEKVVLHQTESAYRYAAYEQGRYLNDTKLEPDEMWREDIKIFNSLLDFVYCFSNEILYDTKKLRKFTTVNQIKNFVSFISGSAKNFDYILRYRLLSVADDVCFFPFPEKLESELNYYNTFRPVKVEAGSGTEGIEEFQDHCRYMCNEDETDSEIFMDYLSVFFTRIGTKSRSAVYLSSPFQGTGKSLFELFARKTLGDTYVTIASGRQITQGHNAFMLDKLLCFVNELDKNGKYSAMVDLNVWITEPKIQISDKYMRSFITDNFCNFIFFSNPQNSLHIDEKDRRFFVLRNNNRPKPKEVYKRLVQIFSSDLRWNVYEWLAKRNISLDVYAPAPGTKAKTELQALSQSEAILYLDDMDKSGELNDMEGITPRKLLEALEYRVPNSIKKQLSLKQISMWLTNNHYREKNVFVKEGDSKKHKRFFVKDEAKA